MQISALQEMGKHSPDAVVIVDRDEGKVAFANVSASGLLGINTGDRTEKFGALIESVATSDQDYIKNKYQQVLGQPATTDVEFRMVGSKGDDVWISCDAFLVDRGKYVYAVARDITKSKDHERYLVEYGARKNTLLDTVMHQLNGSLMLMNNLALRAETLNVTKDQASLESFVSLIHNTSKHSIDIIEDLLKKEHTESPGIHVKFSRTDVVKIVTYIFDELQKTRSNRLLTFEKSADEIFVNTDDMKLLQIVNNFASNAMKFTREEDEIKISVHETAFSVVIAVADTGIGIPAALQQFVFEKHGPARRTGLNGEKSVGLGLSICNHLTNLLGGRVWFESKEGDGSAFFVELPKE